ncbi:MAG TPA: bifunctional phosphoglucose/phosphomannose isomerase [Dehalococcoidia bacterium]|nr:bifunctional phosphoglucose/phosphomannose isomerase [Dehalococcoidia bacterium]
MDILDDPNAQSQLDRQQLLLALRDLPRQCEAAWEEAQSLSLPESYRGIEKIIVAAVGGSAIAGDYLRQLLAEGSQVPVFSHRGYGFPSYVDSHSLVIASSYSGETEETLSALMATLPSEAKPLVITSGGRLLAVAQEEGLPHFVITYSSQPRCALGYSLMPLLAAAERVGALSGAAEMIAEAVAAMRRRFAEINEDVPLTENPAKQLAQRLQGKLPVVYGGDVMREVVRRWKTQLNENAKVWAFTEILPEANHNALAAYRLPASVAKNVFVVLLKPAGLHPRIERRYAFTQEALAEAHVESEAIEAAPGGTLAQMLDMTFFGDYVSYYLAILNGVDPTSIEPIERIKESLKR